MGQHGVADLVERAIGGDAWDLELLAREMIDLVYQLAVRVLGDVEQADEATREIVIRLVTSLDTFRGERTLHSWVYRVACEHLWARHTAPGCGASFDQLADRLAAGLVTDTPAACDAVLVEETKLSCTSAMLQCLERDERVAFVLCDMIGLPAAEAADLVEVAPEVFEARLVHARARLDAFVRRSCGLADPARPCRCAKQAGGSVARGLIDRRHLAWARRARARLHDGAAEHAAHGPAIAMFRALPPLVGPESLAVELRDLIVGRVTLSLN